MKRSKKSKAYRFREEKIAQKPKKRFFTKKKIFITLFLGGILLFISFIIVEGFILPKIEVEKAYKPNAITYIYSDDNALIGHLCLEKKIFIPINNIPKVLQEAFISAEDRNFYNHSGIDFGGIIRAGFKNIFAGRIVQGGSTITQQVARWMFLSKERTMSRKIKEAILAIRLEKKLTKKQILELYLNQIYFGHGAYGVEIAARDYFNKGVSKLNLAESALLAGLPKAPNTYSPVRNPSLAKKRRDYVLERLYEDGKISKQQKENAREEPIILNPYLADMEAAPYFIDYLGRELQEKYSSNNTYDQEIKVYTTLNRRLQRIAIQSLKEGLRELDKRQIDPQKKTAFRGPLKHLTLEEVGNLEDFDWGFDAGIVPKTGSIVTGIIDGVNDDQVTVKVQRFKGVMKSGSMKWAFAQGVKQKPADLFSIGDVIKVRVLKLRDKDTLELGLEQDPLVQGAIAAINPKTGEVKALVGGYDFDKSQFNRAISAKREPGSAFKPIIYLTALKEGYTPASVIIDSPIVFGTSKDDSLWRPENFGNKFYGPTLLRDALIQSRNVCTVKLLKHIGIPPVIENARILGIKSPLEKNLSLALGTSALSLFELTNAYTVFANLGEKIEPTSIRQVKGKTGSQMQRPQSKESSLNPGKEQEEGAGERERVFDDDVTFVLVKILEGVVEEGTGKGARVLGFPVAGKTGTTNNYMDAWFIGFTPNLVVGVWVGYDGKKTLGRGETGARAALPIWVRFMREAIKDQPIEDFPEPDEVVTALVDPKTGKLAKPDTKDPELLYFIEGTEPGENGGKEIDDSNKFFQLGE